jgi:hypothetical protein
VRVVGPVIAGEYIRIFMQGRIVLRGTNYLLGLGLQMSCGNWTWRLKLRM